MSTIIIGCLTALGSACATVAVRRHWRASQIAKRQLAALADAVGGLARAAHPDDFLVHVLRAIAEQLDAHWVMLFLHDPAADVLEVQLVLKEGQIIPREQATPNLVGPLPARGVPIWVELERTRRPIHVADVGTDPRLRQRDALVAQGVRSMLVVPLIVGEALIGWFSVRNTSPRIYRPDELDLAAALAQQAALAVQLSRLGAQGRQAAVLAERNRMAHEIHDTLAQGFTGIVMQLEASESALDVAQDNAIVGDVMASVTRLQIEGGLDALGLGASTSVIVHSSLRSFGQVEGGALTVCEALIDVCGTVLMPAGTWDLTGIPAPPGLVRSHNAVLAAATWDEFDAALARAVPFAPDLPIDRELGHIPETLRQAFTHWRGTHPLLSYVAVGRHAQELAAAQRLDWPLGSLQALADRGGDVLLLGVDHTVNTMIHLAEQRLGCSRFFRYAKAAVGVWMELPNIPGESHRFDNIEPHLAGSTREVQIGSCRARCVAARAVLAAATQVIAADPAALLCDDPTCRCGAALQQRLAWLRRNQGDHDGGEAGVP